MEEIKNLEKIKKIIERLLDMAGFQWDEVEIINNEENQENSVFNIKTSTDSKFLIGQYGINLQALQHIVRLLIKREVKEKINFILDVNSYKQEKNFAIIQKARLAAEQAIKDNKSVVLSPMNAYERRVVHLELNKNEKVTTESLGEGEERKVIVKPIT